MVNVKNKISFVCIWGVFKMLKFKLLILFVDVFVNVVMFNFMGSNRGNRGNKLFK